MKKYSTKIHVITQGENEIEAQERAGKIFNIERMLPDMVISCGPSRPVVPYGQKRALQNKFKSIVCVTSEGIDGFEAGEKAGELIDLGRMDIDMMVSCEPTCEVESRLVCEFESRKDDFQE